MGKNYGYCRVSSMKQFTDGNGLDAQQEDIKSKYPDAEIYVEQFTGSTTDRPIFNDLINNLVSGDTLVVSKLDRLARNTVEGIEIIKKMFDLGVDVHVLNIGRLENTYMGKFFITTLLAVAEMERSQILERTQAGKAIARTKAGFKEGRPKKYTTELLDYAYELLKTNSYTEVAKKTNISESTIARYARKKRAEEMILNE